ncbi:MAG: hypothetical protein ACK5XV_11530 [Flavobacteriales bacterium]|jgi:hypothetical protein
MNASDRFKSIQELAAGLHDAASRLANGSLKTHELEELTETARELYERIVILRHRAYDCEIREERQEEQPKETQSISFRLPTPIPQQEAPATVKQVSLIDAIDEITRAEEPEALPAVMPPAGAPAPPVTPAESLNERLSRNIPTQETLARKLESSPISDLKRAITLNQRFQFSRELFKGNNQDYEVTIDRLNTASREDALKTLDNLRSRYEWNDESQVTQDFLELVQRRHQP